MEAIMNCYLNKKVVLDEGVNFDDLHYDYDNYGDAVLEGSPKDNQKLFTGLCYELYENGQIEYYAFYKEGFIDGEMVEFYIDGKVKSVSHLSHGRSNGVCKTFYPTGEQKSVAIEVDGITVESTEWDMEGNIIRKKQEPSKWEQRLLNNLKE